MQELCLEAFLPEACTAHQAQQHLACLVMHAELQKQGKAIAGVHG